MALAIASSFSGVSRTTGLVSVASDYTVTFWYRPRDLTLTVGRVVWLLVDDVNVYADYIAIFSVNPTPNEIYLEISDNGVLTTSVTVPIQENGYSAISYVRTGTAHKFYVNGALMDTLTKDVSGLTIGAQYLADDTFTDEVQAHYEYYREYSNDLTLAQVLDEQNSPTPVITTNLNANTPLVDDFLDTTANNNDWTEVGTTSFDEGPLPTPITNLTGAAAVDLGGLNNSFCQVVRLSTGTTEDTWWTYTAPADTSPMMSWWAFGQIGVYNVLTNAYADASGSTDYTPNIFNYAQRPIEVPVYPGTQVWLRAVPNAGNPRAALWIRTRTWNQSTPPAGSLLINDAATNFPATITSEPVGTAGLTTPLQYRGELPGGELMQATEDGTIFLQDLGATNFKIFNAAFEEVATIGNYGTNAIGTNRTTLFYQSLMTTVRAFNRAGAETASYGTLPITPAALAPDRDDALLYYMEGGANRVLRTWNLATNTAANNALVAGVAGYGVAGMIMLGDGTLLVTYKQTSGSPPDVFVRRYNAAGTTLNTYSTQLDESSGADTHLAHALDDPTSFWVWIKIAGGRSSFINLRTSDGTVIKQAYGRHFTAGSWDGTTTADPDQLFGHSESCQFLILGNPTPEETSFVEEERVPVRVRRAPHLSNEQQVMFYDEIQYEFESGVGLTDCDYREPVCEHRWSDDGGHTFSNLNRLGLGRLGQYKFRTRQMRLGRSRDRVFEVRVSDPVRANLIRAILKITPGNGA